MSLGMVTVNCLLYSWVIHQMKREGRGLAFPLATVIRWPGGGGRGAFDFVAGARNGDGRLCVSKVMFCVRAVREHVG